MARPAFWHGTTWLGGWVVAVLATALAGRGLAAWQRLCEGGEARVAPPVALAPLCWVLLAWVVGGLWTGHHPLTAAPDRLWYGLHWSLGASFLAAAGARQRWLLWWLPTRWTDLWGTLWAVVDAGLVALLAPLVWFLAQRVTGAPTHWPAGGATGELALLMMVAASWLTATGGSPRAARTSTIVLLGVPVLWLLRAISDDSPTGHGWAGRWFGWSLAIETAAGLLALLPILVALPQRGRADGQQVARRTGEQSLTWRLLPAAWRDNPLVLKGLRTASRRGFVRASGWAMGALAMAGLALGLAAEPLLAQGPARSGSAGSVAAFLGLHVLVSLGQGYADSWLGAALGSSGAAFLGLSGLLAIGMGTFLPFMAALTCGKVVTQERVHGSLGFVLLSDLSDQEVADGYLLGQLYPVVELLVYFAVTVLLWSLASLQWQLVGLAILAIGMVSGLVAAAAAAALLGTARYAHRADGTLDARVGLWLFQATGWGTVLLANRVATAGGGAAAAGWVLATVWSGVTLMVGLLAWRATPAAFRRLRRTCRMWQAFDPAGRETERDGGL